jgi:hypothetical protein
VSQQALLGAAAIAAAFGKHHVRFFQRYSKELAAYGAIFKVLCGKPPRVRWAAFPCELARWASLKGQKGEVI